MRRDRRYSDSAPLIPWDESSLPDGENRDFPDLRACLNRFKHLSALDLVHHNLQEEEIRFCGSGLWPMPFPPWLPTMLNPLRFRSIMRRSAISGRSSTIKKIVTMFSFPHSVLDVELSGARITTGAGSGYRALFDGHGLHE